MKVWDQDSDPFNRADLIFNWEAIDDDYTRPRVADRVEILAALPGAGNFDGRLVYLTAANGSFPAKTMVRYNGSSWRAVGPMEVLAALPTSNNYQGRIVALTAADGGFAANDVVVNTNGATSWKKVGGVGVGAALPGSPVAGDLFLLNTAASGFDAWSLVVYNGSAWIRTERRGVEVGTTLPLTPYTGQVFVLTAAASGFQAYDMVLYNGSTWKNVVENTSTIDVATFQALTGLYNGKEVKVAVDANTIWHLRYVSAIADAYKWVVLGGAPLYDEYLTTWTISSTTFNTGTPAASSPSLTAPVDGVYDLTWGARIDSRPDMLAYISPNGGGITASDGNSVVHGALSSGFNSSVNVYARVQSNVQGTRRFTLDNASACQLQYKKDVTAGTNSSGHVSIHNTTFSMMPVRVAQT